jgi:hypothetical protein
MKGRAILLTTILTLFLFCGTIPITPQVETMLQDNYYVWSTWTMEEKVAYVLGFMEGITGFYCELSEKFPYYGFASEAKKYIPAYSLRDYVTGIEYIYEAPETRNVAVWLIIFRFDYFFELRRTGNAEASSPSNYYR